MSALPRLGVDLDSDHEDDSNYLSRPKVGSLDAHGVGDIDGGDGLSEFPTYEDYLDSQILPEDIKYLEVSTPARRTASSTLLRFSAPDSLHHFLCSASASFHFLERGPDATTRRAGLPRQWRGAQAVSKREELAVKEPLPLSTSVLSLIILSCAF